MPQATSTFAQLTDNQQYGLAGIFLAMLVVVGKLLLEAHNKSLAAKDAQIADLKTEKERLIKRLEVINDAARRKKE